MRKTFAVLVLVGLAFVLVTSPVLAANGPKRRAHVISFTGTVASVGRGSIEVNVPMTNKPFVVKRGQTVTVTMTSRTVYVSWDGRTATRLPSAPVFTTGQRVSINALVTTTGTTTTITARRIELNKPRYP